MHQNQLRYLSTRRRFFRVQRMAHISRSLTTLFPQLVKTKIHIYQPLDYAQVVVVLEL